jgi:hypothetical protein
MVPAGRPDFVVIGAQRSGTTWLHHVLRRHRQIWLPPIKELHYFDRKRLRRGWERRNEWLQAAVAITRSPGWAFNYLCGLRSDEWYARLFERAQSRGFITGEIAPDYATLSDNVFCRIRSLNPNMKLIFIMREPVERAWSGVTRRFKLGRITPPLTEERALEVALSPKLAARADYLTTIERVERIFPRGQLHFCFFDDLSERPTAFLSELLTFLDADTSGIESMSLPNAINSSARDYPMTEGFVCRMILEYQPIVSRLAARFEGPPKNWLAKYKDVGAKKSHKQE